MTKQTEIEISQVLGHEINLHDVGLVNSGDTGPLIIPGVLEGILSNALAGLLCNELDTLHHSINNLKRYTKEKFR